MVMAKIVTGAILFTLLLFQYQIWFGASSIREINALEQRLEQQRSSNDGLRERNHLLEIEVIDLKNGLEAVEERARSELGLISKDETFYMIVEPPETRTPDH